MNGAGKEGTDERERFRIPSDELSRMQGNASPRDGAGGRKDGWALRPAFLASLFVKGEKGWVAQRFHLKQFRSAKPIRVHSLCPQIVTKNGEAVRFQIRIANPPYDPQASRIQILLF